MQLLKLLYHSRRGLIHWMNCKLKRCMRNTMDGRRIGAKLMTYTQVWSCGPMRNTDTILWFTYVSIYASITKCFRSRAEVFASWNSHRRHYDGHYFVFLKAANITKFPHTTCKYTSFISKLIQIVILKHHSLNWCVQRIRKQFTNAR